MLQYTQVLERQSKPSKNSWHNSVDTLVLGERTQLTLPCHAPAVRAPLHFCAAHRRPFRQPGMGGRKSAC